MTAHNCILVVEDAEADRHAQELVAAGAHVLASAHSENRVLIEATFTDGPLGADIVRDLRQRGLRAVSGPRSPGERSGWSRRTAPVEFAPGCCICLPWSQFDRGTFSHIIEIDPGSGFGAGGHPSTQLLLAWIQEQDLRGKRVLDVGCGTGVLSILAAQRGGTVTAIDIAEAALAATTRNASWNAVTDSLTVSSESMAELQGPFDLVLANIHAPILEGMAADFRRVLVPGGAAALSGISRAQTSRLAAKLKPLLATDQWELDDWVAMTLT